MPIMSKLQAAYLAGIIDGEGCILISKRKQGFWIYQLEIGNTDKGLIEWLKNSFGGSVVEVAKKPDKNQKVCWRWTMWNKEQMIRILEKVKPYLKVKKSQAEIMMKFAKTFEKENYRYRRDEKGHIKERYRKEGIDKLREKLYLDIKKLNQRGILAV